MRKKIKRKNRVTQNCLYMKRKKDPRAKEKEERRDMSPVLKERLKKVIPLLTDKQKYMKKTTMIQDGKTKVGQVIMLSLIHI